MTVNHESTGIYTIDFETPVSDAVIVATPVHAVGGEGTPSVINAGTQPSSPRRIIVKTFAWSARPNDQRFGSGPLLDAAFKFVVITAPDLRDGDQPRLRNLRLEAGRTLFWGAVNADGSVTRLSPAVDGRNLLIQRVRRGKYTIALPDGSHDAIIVATPVHIEGGELRPTVVNASTIPGVSHLVEVTTFKHATPGEGGFAGPEIEDAPFKFVIITAPDLGAAQRPNVRSRLALEEAQTIFWGAVNADGSFTRASGVPAARNMTLRRDGDGRYTLLLGRPAADAVVVATPVHAIGGQTQPSVVTAGSRAGFPNEIAVDTFNAGLRHDAPFKFIVITA